MLLKALNTLVELCDVILVVVFRYKHIIFVEMSCVVRFSQGFFTERYCIGDMKWFCFFMLVGASWTWSLFGIFIADLFCIAHSLEVSPYDCVFLFSVWCYIVSLVLFYWDSFLSCYPLRCL